MSLILPVSLLAQDVAGAIVHSSGNGVFVNENPAPASIAIFPNDVVQTQKNVAARIELVGSTAQINPETMVQFEGEELVLDHGSVSVNTSRGERVRVGCITVTPVNSSEWTQYDVIDVSGKVTVSALKSDVYIDERTKNAQSPKESANKQRTIVHEGEQKSREEKCAGAYMQSQPVQGVGAVMNSPYMIWAATGAAGAIACFGLCHDDDPLSPHKP
jgi:hypothetical protein